MLKNKSAFNLQDADFSNPKQTGLHLFISDLHLCASRPKITLAFLRFLQDIATTARSLYILGDLFEYWAGDDDLDDPCHKSITAAFQALANAGVSVYLMHGNRDFLIADDFCKATKVTLLSDPSLIHLNGKNILLSHGDSLCLDDTAYQDFRRQVRNIQWQSNFLSQPLLERKRQIEVIRQQSTQEKSRKTAEIMDVNEQAVEALLTAYDYPELFIHGHTHRPCKHQVEVNGHQSIRWVLGDWYEQGSYLALDNGILKSTAVS